MDLFCRLDGMSPFNLQNEGTYVKCESHLSRCKDIHNRTYYVMVSPGIYAPLPSSSTLYLYLYPYRTSCPKASTTENLPYHRKAKNASLLLCNTHTANRALYFLDLLWYLYNIQEVYLIPIPKRLPISVINTVSFPLYLILQTRWIILQTRACSLQNKIFAN